jgi:superfamily II DNA or RNA helicase
MGVRIFQGPVWSRLEGPPEVVDAVRAALTVKSPTARFSRAHRSGHWDGTVKFLRMPKGIFLTGLTDRVMEVCKGYLPATDVVKIPVCLPRKPPLADALVGLEWRDYLTRAVEEAVARGRVALQVPTGGGKTEIGLEIVRRVGHNTLWLTHKKDIFAQTIERARLRLPGVDVGRIGAGVMDPKFPLTIGMVQTLKGIDDKDPFWAAWRMVVMDECHHCSSNTWFEIAQRLRYAPLRLGLSGTASSKDPIRDMRLEGATGRIINVVSTDTLVKQGFLARPTIYMLRPPAHGYPVGRDFRELDPRGAERFQAVYQAGIVENQDRNFLVRSIARTHVGKGEKVLVLVTRIQHGEDLKEQIEAPTTWCEWLSGKEPLDRRQQVLEVFKKTTRGAALVASTIFDEGIDIPELDVLIIAGAGESSIRSMQRIGRALRPRPDKGDVVIYDFLDGKSPLKGTKVTGDDYLALHSRARLRDYTNEKFKVVFP